MATQSDRRSLVLLLAAAPWPVWPGSRVMTVAEKVEQRSTEREPWTP